MDTHAKIPAVYRNHGSPQRSRLETPGVISSVMKPRTATHYITHVHELNEPYPFVSVSGKKAARSNEKYRAALQHEIGIVEGGHSTPHPGGGGACVSRVACLTRDCRQNAVHSPIIGILCTELGFAGVLFRSMELYWPGAGLLSLTRVNNHKVSTGSDCTRKHGNMRCENQSSRAAAACELQAFSSCLSTFHEVGAPAGL